MTDRAQAVEEAPADVADILERLQRNCDGTSEGDASTMREAAALITRLSADLAARDALAEALAVIAYEDPDEPWLVAHNALKNTANPMAQQGDQSS